LMERRDSLSGPNKSVTSWSRESENISDSFTGRRNFRADMRVLQQQFPSEQQKNGHTD
jgi:hypothetical protein